MEVIDDQEEDELSIHCVIFLVPSFENGREMGQEGLISR
jgi:hypothetical protein